MLLTRWLPAWKMRLPVLYGLHHGEPVGNVVRHGFFAVDVFAGGEAVEHDAAVLEVGDRNDDGVDIFAIEERAVVARGGHVGAPGFDAGLLVHIVEVGDGRPAHQWEPCAPSAADRIRECRCRWRRSESYGPRPLATFVPREQRAKKYGMDRGACGEGSCAEAHKTSARHGI